MGTPSSKDAAGMWVVGTLLLAVGLLFLVSWKTALAVFLILQAGLLFLGVVSALINGTVDEEE